MDELIKLGGKILGMAPALAGAIMSPNPVSVGNALGAIKSALGLGADASPSEINAAITGTPEEVLKLAIAENDFRVAMRKADNEELFTRLSDVQNARNAQTEQLRITGIRDISGEIFDWLITAGFFIVLGIRMFVIIPADQTENVGMLLGVLGTAFITVVNFKRGSSQSSRDKDALLKRL